jgi:hypothetical protein
MTAASCGGIEMGPLLLIAAGLILWILRRRE